MKLYNSNILIVLGASLVSCYPYGSYPDLIATTATTAHAVTQEGFWSRYSTFDAEVIKKIVDLHAKNPIERIADLPELAIGPKRTEFAEKVMAIDSSKYKLQCKSFADYYINWYIQTLYSLSSECTSTYKVANGDSCEKIALNNNITLSRLIALNPSIEECSKISLGDILCIKTSQCNNVYTVKTGDTCATISAAAKITADYLKTQNPSIKDCNYLTTGQTICLGDCEKSYTVQKYDTLEIIAQGYKTSVTEILQANPSMSDPKVLIEGKSLCIPAQKQCANSYIVKDGDDFLKIAQFNGFYVNQITALNPNIAHAALTVGQMICLPENKKCLKFYKVVQGDNIFKISEKTGISTQSLIFQNSDIHDLRADQILCLSSIEATVTCKNTYISKSGDTCLKVSKDNFISLTDLIAANPKLNDCDSIYPGKSICIPHSACENKYAVKAGDTCNEIAKMNGLKVSDLIEKNPLVGDCTYIVPGQILCLPIKTPVCYDKYTTVAGDTCSSISKNQRVLIADLVAANPSILDCSYILPGKVLCLPPCYENCQNSYEVKKGDTLFNIALEKGVQLAELLAKNPEIKDLNSITPGQKICFSDDLASYYCSEKYLVKAGDTVYNIANLESLGYKQLIAANPLIGDGSLIYPGQLLCIPPCHNKCERSYTVKSEDTSFTIAAANAVNYLELQAINPSIKDFTRIYPGQVLCLPKSLERPINPYSVQIGDTVQKISSLKNVSISSLIAANPGYRNLTVIYPGQILSIPQPECSTYYITKINETIIDLSVTLHVSVWDILQKNPSLKQYPMVTGKVLCLPPPIKCDRQLIIQKSDTCESIQKTYDVTIEELYSVNTDEFRPLSCSKLFIGQKVCLPQCLSMYNVKSGDVCHKIAEKNGLFMQELIDLNPGSGNCSLIYPGQRLCVSNGTITFKYLAAVSKNAVSSFKARCADLEYLPTPTPTPALGLQTKAQEIVTVQRVQFAPAETINSGPGMYSMIDNLRMSAGTKISNLCSLMIIVALVVL